MNLIQAIMNSYLALKSPKKLLQIWKLVEKCFSKPVLLSHNQKFLELYKTLLEDENKCEWTSIEWIHRV